MQVHSIPTSCERCGVPVVGRSGRANRFCSFDCYRAAKRDNIVDPETRFWRHVQKDTASGCWLWIGALGPKGHGIFNSGDKHNVITSRYAWYLATGAWPAGDECALHVCDTPACVRNDDIGTYELNGRSLPRRGHLFLGTKADNNEDMHAKDRHACGDAVANRGEQHPLAKLNADAVRAIRARAANGERQYLIAAAFGISTAKVSQVVRRTAWTHVN